MRTFPCRSYRKSKACAGSVGLAVALCLSAAVSLTSLVGLAARSVASSPIPPDFAGWLSGLSTLLTLVLLALHVRKEMQPNPALDEQFVPRTELDLRFGGLKQEIDAHTAEITRLRADGERQHGENVERLDALADKLDRNRADVGKEHVALREDLRHDVRNELSPVKQGQALEIGKVNDRLNEMGRTIGGLEAKTDIANSSLVAVRQTLETLLSRTAPPARGGGGR